MSVMAEATSFYLSSATLLKTFTFLALLLTTSGFLAATNSISIERRNPSTYPLRRLTNMMMSTATTSTSPDVSRFMAGDRPDGTRDFIMQQTMLRVKDPMKSLEFYCDVLGFRLVMHSEFPQWGFNVYFVAPVDSGTIPAGDDRAARWRYCMNLPGCIELTYNYGSEREEGPVYNTGNADPTGTTNGEKIRGGFGHIGITVPDVYEACERFKAMGCAFHKTPNSGGMKGLAFIKDPDGYLVEILPQGPMISKPVDCDGVPAEGGEGYKDNSK
jgi:lactoylglutathione lyase